MHARLIGGMRYLLFKKTIYQSASNYPLNQNWKDNLKNGSSVVKIARQIAALKKSMTNLCNYNSIPTAAVPMGYGNYLTARPSEQARIEVVGLNWFILNRQHDVKDSRQGSRKRRLIKA